MRSKVDSFFLVQREAAAADPGVVERHIQTPIGRDGRLDHLSAILAPGDVDLAEDRLAARFPRQGGGAFALDRVHVGDEHASALGGEADAGGAADAAAAARNDDGFPFKSARHEWSLCKAARRPVSAAAP